MMHKYLIIAASVLFFSAGAMSASRVGTFMEDFQDGIADGWKAGGEGTAQLTTYAGNYSLRLTKKAYAMIMLPVADASVAHVSAAFAAANLEGKDACIAEVSVDKGTSWVEIHRVEDGADDSVTLHVGSGEVMTPAEGSPLIVRLRVDGNGDDDTCWADNIKVVVTSDKTSKPETGPRRALTADFLLGNERLARPLPMSAFMPTSEARPATASFQGRLTFTPSIGDGSLETLKDSFDYMVDPLPGIRVPPAFDMEIVQDAGRLIPVDRSLIRTSNESWDLFVEPGRVWSEPDDQGYTRAALPFALQERNANCTHNGVMSFLFKADGTMSRVAYQIASETCLYFKFNMWGTVSAEYQQSMLSNSQEVLSSYQQELSRRIPIKPISALSVDYPNLNSKSFGSPTDVSPEHMTTFGVVIDGVHYRSGCETRFGAYPFCESIVLPSYSVAKSVFAGLGMMRLEKIYPGVFQAKISEYVPACTAKEWKGVTLGQTLDMTTGRYNSQKGRIDEKAAGQNGFFTVLSHEEKIDLACTLYPKRSKPGRKLAYHTTDHYILGTAMQAYLRERQGPEADIHRDLLVKPIFKKIGLSPLSYRTRRTRDALGQPFVGFGLSFLPDDFAKLGQFIASQNGKWKGEGLVDTYQLSAALQRHSEDRGLTAPDTQFRYKNGFWAFNAASRVKCDHSIWVPFMSGYGGISIVLMPNGIVYYYVSDNNEFAWARTITEANKYKSMCERGG